MEKKILLAGESWSSTLMEVKGFNSFFSSKYETGLGWIDKAIEKAGYELVYMPNHVKETKSWKCTRNCSGCICHYRLDCCSQEE